MSTAGVWTWLWDCNRSRWVSHTFRLRFGSHKGKPSSRWLPDVPQCLLCPCLSSSNDEEAVVGWGVSYWTLKCMAWWSDTTGGPTTFMLSTISGLVDNNRCSVGPERCVGAIVSWARPFSMQQSRSVASLLAASGIAERVQSMSGKLKSPMMITGESTLQQLLMTLHTTSLFIILRNDLTCTGNCIFLCWG